MSNTVKGKIFTEGFAVCWRKRPCGKNSYTYQVRFQRGGYNIQFHEKRKENLKQRFLEELKKQTHQQEENQTPSTFSKFAMLYFEKFRKIKVAELTYKFDLGRFRRYLEPFFQERKLTAITPTDCQTLLENVKKEGKGKTADELYSLMNGIFNCAIKHHLLQYSPMDTVVHVQHERKNGKALTKEEEKQLLNAYTGTRFELLFAVALYTGLRPNEYATARIEGDFIIARNSKRKTKKKEYKRIPITPMLRPYLQGVTGFDFPSCEVMRDRQKAILPNHILYDLRTTFHTRCKECGVADPARKEFMGHSQGEKLDDTYTDLSNEYLLKEGAKIVY